MRKLETNWASVVAGVGCATFWLGMAGLVLRR